MKTIDEMFESSLDELLSKAARMKRSRVLRAKGKQIARKRKLALKRKATPEKLKARAMKKARELIAKRILKDRKKGELSLAGKEALEKKLSTKKAVIKRIAKRILPKVRSAEAERLKKRGEKNETNN
tara:strand:- start:4366 stop:4746 length:381 start_codon:yes stop_codon:yes gene_type:complete